MDLEELRKLLRSLYWAFKTTDKWPQWVKNKDGTKAYPFSALVMNPETFCNDENDEVCSIIYIYIFFSNNHSSLTILLRLYYHQ